MKKLFSVSILSIVLLLGSFSFASQAPKFGHIDTNQLMSIMPGRDSAQIKLESYARELEATFVSMQNEFQTKYQDFLEKQSTFSDLIRQSRERELRSLQERIMEFQESAQQDLVDQENRLLSPIIDQARQAIEAVAREEGFTYIFDTSMGMLLYWERGEDIMPKVRQKLGI